MNKRGATRKPRQTDEGREPHILSIPVHRGKPVKKGLLLDQIKKAGLTVEEFLEFYK